MDMDEDLIAIERIQSGDQSALLDLMSRHKVAVFRFTMRYTGNEADSAEITEQTFYRVYLNAQKYRSKARLRTWIFSIAANLSRDFLRRRKKLSSHLSLDAASNHEDSSSLIDVVPSGVADPAEEAQSHENLERIEIAVRSLPHKLKFPFIFCVLEEHSYDECAEVLKTSRKTVETRIYRARQILRKQLSKYHENL